MNTRVCGTSLWARNLLNEVIRLVKLKVTFKSGRTIETSDSNAKTFKAAVTNLLGDPKVVSRFSSQNGFVINLNEVESIVEVAA